MNVSIWTKHQSPFPIKPPVGPQKTYSQQTGSVQGGSPLAVIVIYHDCKLNIYYDQSNIIDHHKCLVTAQDRIMLLLTTSESFSLLINRLIHCPMRSPSANPLCTTSTGCHGCSAAALRGARLGNMAPHPKDQRLILPTEMWVGLLQLHYNHFTTSLRSYSSTTSATSSSTTRNNYSHRYCSSRYLPLQLGFARIC